MVFIEDVIQEAIKKGASDIHLMKGQKPHIRVKKDLKRLDHYSVVEDEDVFEFLRFLFQDNEKLNEIFYKEKFIDFNYNYHGTRLRVNISKSMNSDIFTLRIIPQTLPSYESLHLPDVLRNLISLPQGMILITGKSNSGKSTTLNAIVNEINRTESKKILTLENPIEFVHQSNHSLIVQKEVGEGRDCETFSEGVKNALREDCDILIVGEIRDRETMDASIEMAESGHLVIGTMHTRSCAETIDRILNFYQAEEQSNIKNIVSVLLIAVIAQRLIKGLTSDLILVPEIMIVDDIISALIRKDKFSRSEIEDAIQTKMDKGSISLIHSLAKAIADDWISLEEAQKQINPDKYETLSKITRQMRLFHKNNSGSGIRGY